MFVGMLRFLPTPRPLEPLVFVLLVGLTLPPNGCLSWLLDLANTEDEAVRGLQLDFLATREGRFSLSSGSVDSELTEPSFVLVVCSLIFDICFAGLARPRLRAATSGLRTLFLGLGGGGGRTPFASAATPIFIPMRRGAPPRPEDDTPESSISG